MLLVLGFTLFFGVIIFGLMLLVSMCVARPKAKQVTGIKRSLK